jgi:hypothetical protein
MFAEGNLYRGLLAYDYEKGYLRGGPEEMLSDLSMGKKGTLGISFTEAKLKCGRPDHLNASVTRIGN